MIAAARPYQDAAEREEQIGDTRTRKVAALRPRPAARQKTSQRIVEQHRALPDTADAGRAALADHREVRAGWVETLTPEVLAAADLARNIYRAERTRRHEPIANKSSAPARWSSRQSLEINHGFGIEM